MKTKEKKDSKIKVSCVLKGSKKCPKPNECNGIIRQCTVWINHSGR